MAKDIKSEKDIELLFGSEETDPTPVVKIGEVLYVTLADAVASVPTNTPTTIVFIRDAKGAGVIVNDGQIITFDLNSFTYDVDITVGSEGTKTNGFQLLKGSKVEFKNGKIISSTAKILVQNYCELTLNNIVVDQSDKDICKYVVSNNCGSFSTEGNTIIKAATGKVAFDVYYGMADVYDEGVKINIGMGTTLAGKIEYGAAPRVTTTDWTEKAKVEISETVDLSETTFESTTEGVIPNIKQVTPKGVAQGKNMQVTTTIETGNIPQFDTATWKNRIRFISDGDIRKDGKSVVADKMVNEANHLQISKSVINSFPSDASAYYKSLDFKVR